MTDAENPRAVIGDNVPPDPLIVEASERVDTANKWLVERPAITDKDMADRAAFFISQCAATFTALDNQRLTEGRAFKAVQAEKYDDPLSLLTLAKDKLTKLRTAWLKKEEDRLAAEKAAIEAEARRKREEAEAAAKRLEEEAKTKGGDPLRAQVAADNALYEAQEAERAAAEAPTKAVIKGNYTRVAVGLKDRWGAEITDISAAFKHYNSKKHPSKPILEAAIRACILDIAKKESVALKNLDLAPPGIKFTKERV